MLHQRRRAGLQCRQRGKRASNPAFEMSIRCTWLGTANSPSWVKKLNNKRLEHVIYHQDHPSCGEFMGRDRTRARVTVIIVVTLAARPEIHGARQNLPKLEVRPRPTLVGGGLRRRWRCECFGGGFVCCDDRVAGRSLGCFPRTCVGRGLRRRRRCECLRVGVVYCNDLVAGRSLRCFPRLH